MRKFLAALIGLGLIAGFLFSACGGGDDDETVDLPGGGEVSTSDDLPDDFPDDFPVYDGADVVGSITSEQEGAEGHVVTWETGDSIDDVTEFYEKEFEDGPWKSSGSGSFSGTASFTVTHEDDEKKVGSVIVSEGDDDKTSIVAFVGEQPDDASSGDDDGGDDPTPDGSDDGSDDSDGDSGSDPDATLPDEVDLDEDFPEDRVPLPDDVRVTSSSKFSAGGAETFLIEFYKESDVEGIKDFYDSEMSGKGWADSFTTETNGEAFMSFTGEGDAAANEAVTISISNADVEGYVQVALSVTKTAE